MMIGDTECIIECSFPFANIVMTIKSKEMPYTLKSDQIESRNVLSGRMDNFSFLRE